MQKGKGESDPDRERCLDVTIENLPEDDPERSSQTGEEKDAPAAQTVAKPGAPKESVFEPGCILGFTVQGVLPEQMPVGRELKELLGVTGGLAFVEFDRVRHACYKQTRRTRIFNARVCKPRVQQD